MTFNTLPPLIAFLFILFGLLVLAALVRHLRDHRTALQLLTTTYDQLEVAQQDAHLCNEALAIGAADQARVNEAAARWRSRAEALEAELLRGESHRQALQADLARMHAWTGTAHQLGLQAQREIAERWYGRNAGKQPTFIHHLAEHCAVPPDRRATQPVPVSETGLGR